MMGNENYSLADLGLEETGPTLDWQDEASLEPEELARLHKRSQRIKHPSDWEREHQAWLDGVRKLTPQQMQQEYF